MRASVVSLAIGGLSCGPDSPGSNLGMVICWQVCGGAIVRLSLARVVWFYFNEVAEGMSSLCLCFMRGSPSAVIGIYVFAVAF